MTAFHLFIAFYGPPNAFTLRSTHIGFALVLAFLILPARKANPIDRPNLLSWLLLAASIVVTAYPVIERDYIINRMIYVDDLRTIDFVFGWLMIAVLLEATRRSVGMALPLTAGIFLLYAMFWVDTDPALLLEQMYLTTEGIFGIPASVSATYVMLFILFGALVERTGTGQLFMDFAMSLTGHTAGGPAKVACITSGLFGTVSGSAVANVMTTGTFTIPMMQR
ncbi:MAG: TRAP transporter large permease subunit, partial [Candidatus Competibacteraceae bacterium]|nr:TRAP transporter large permease subunit [Candidatus Competibacteraceae bacterium]